MKLFADLHVHGRYSRGCSKDLNVENLEKYARLKGVGLLGTGDFTHPGWGRELKEKLSEDGSGFARTTSGFPFVYQTEVSLIYTQDGRGRKVHNVVLAPDSGAASQITELLKKRGRVDYDGRPIFKIPCPEFTELMRSVSPDVEVIPAHIWTPWFSMFGSNSGFDSVSACFRDQARHIHAIETGLSSDPPMNWRVPELDNRQILSFSDLHSYWPWRIGREATIFEIKEDYRSLLRAIRTGEGLAGTVEVDPNYGKYHLDGHRNCGVILRPEETKEQKGICPVCRKPLTIGVENRVESLAPPERPPGYKRPGAPAFHSLLPLHELVSIVIGRGIATKQAWARYYDVLKAGKSEFDVLLDAPEDVLGGFAGADLARAIMMNRKGDIRVRPGYDGVYGEPVLGPGQRNVSEEDMKNKNRNTAKNMGGTGADGGKATGHQRPKAPPTAQKGILDFC